MLKRRAFAKLAGYPSIAAILLMAAVPVAVPVVFSPAHAEEGERSAPPKPQTRRVDTLSQRTYEKLTRAQEASGNGQHGTALGILSELLGSDRLSEYEKAVVHQTIGYTHAANDNYAASVRAFEAALAVGALPQQAALDIKYNLGQLYLGLDRVTAAIRWLENWKAEVASPAPRAYALLAQAYAQADRFREAIPYAERAVRNAPEPRENWLQLLISLYLQEERYREALPIVQRATNLFPAKRTYWQQLVGLYSELDEPRNAFAAMRAMHRQNMLTRSSDLVRLAQMYMAFDVPYRAGELISEGMNAGTVEKTASNWELLADAWVLAREWRDAQNALEQAAALSGKGDLYVRLGHSYVEDEAWGNAETALERAVGRGGLNNPGQAWLLLGIARAKQGKNQEALAAFERVQGQTSVRSQAASWIATVNSRLAALNTEADGLADDPDGSANTQ